MCVECILIGFAYCVCVVSPVYFKGGVGYYCVLCLTCFVYMLCALHWVFCEALCAVRFMCALCDVRSV